MLLSGVLSLTTALRAQVVNDGATATLANVTNDITGTVTVGTNGAFTLLVLSDNALLTNSAHGVIGAFATARSNQVHLASPSARWLMGGNLVVGSNGASSTLVVSNGALVGNNQGQVGLLSSNNTVIVTGAGSLWSNRLFVYVGQNQRFNRVRVNEGGRVVSTTLDIGFTSAVASDNEVTVAGANSTWNNGGAMRVGNASSRNLLRVSDGGTVIADGIATIGSTTSGSSNTVIVTDAGSRWLVGTNLFVGGQGAFNRLVISNSGAVFSGSGNLGNNSADNLAVVTGAGSLWINTNNLLVGVAGARNQLVVTNGGTVISGSGNLGSVGSDNLAVVTGAGSLWNNVNNLSVGVGGFRSRLVVTNGGMVSSSNVVIGFDPSSTGNRVLVDGGTLRVASASGAGALDVRRGTNVLNAGLIEVDQLVMTNAAGRFEFNGGTLITRGALVNNGPVAFNVGAAGANPATWNVLAGPNNHFLASHLIVGNSAPFNQLLVTNGALLANGLDAVIGLNSGANSNLAVVSGAGSRWQAIESSFEVGFACSFNRLVITNGGSVASFYSEIGGGTGGDSNEVLVSGAGSSWTNLSELHVGGGGRGNRLVVSSGATVFTAAEQIVGNDSAAVSNIVLVTDPGSRWLGNSRLDVGRRGSFNRLTVSGGGWLACADGALGQSSGANSNTVAIAGSASVWNNTGNLFVGDGGSANALIVSNGATVLASNLFVGFNSSATNNRVIVDGGTLRVTNAAGTGLLEIRRGRSILNGGLMEADTLRMTNNNGLFEFNGGTLSAKNSRVDKFQLVVGNGVSPAAFLLAGNGTHDFSGALGTIIVSSNAVLMGNGTVISGSAIFGPAAVNVVPGGTLSPGNSIGKITFSSPPALSGTVVMEISKNGAVLTNDQIQVTGKLRYGGTLTVSNLGPATLTAGDRFQLFLAGSFSNFFATITLPPLNPGLDWINKLHVDGSIEVVSVPAPGFASITQSGTNVVISGTNGPANAPYAVLTATNVALPLSNWVSLATNQFSAGGAFSFTNGIAPGERQRFFQLRTP